MTLIGAALAFLLLDPPWEWVVIGCLIAIDAMQLIVWWRWRGRRSIAGAEGLIGSRATVVTALDPEGQVRAKGQIWKARAGSAIERGATVEVVAVEGIQVTVAPVVGSHPANEGGG
jgi:membrane-bound serine protease (ClpP class)